MNSLRLMMVALLAAGLALFSYANWVPVEVRLWPGTVVAMPLPLLILGILALVYIPMSLWTRGQKLLLNRRIARLETTLGETEAQLSQARVELLRPPAGAAAPPPPMAVPHAPPPPGT